MSDEPRGFDFTTATSTERPFFFPSAEVRAVLERASELAREGAGHLVAVEHLASALVELHPSVVDDMAPVLDWGLYSRLGRTNRLLGDLNQSMRALTSATRSNTQEETTLVATLDDLTAVTQQLVADDGALKTALDDVVKALADAKAGGFTPEQQAALDAAVADLAQAHTDLVADAKEATEAVTPPSP